ncbi:hypothetical protein A9Q84_08980 [Halobacteriovorax marinus]|uniref:ApaG domain-containing protein n=1 Tax=Halobacteriovorax marinus TaxID=97084 RepID=A0A1Y5FCW7_9BACT|nr:hypothetical protein A9Q84_08980 [Halobacteriovorax marinus]
MLIESTYIETTRDIRVEITPTYLEEKSIPLENDYVFQYSIKIINSNKSDIQILGEEITIRDGRLEEFTLECDEVNGEQACIPFNDSYNYTSYCPIQTSTGNLRGHFWARDIQSGEIFQINIPLIFFRTIDTPTEFVELYRPLYSYSM